MKKLIIAILVSIGCFSTNAADEKISVFVSIQPQAFIVKKICGDHAEVGVLIPPGKNPHTYEPTAKQIVLMTQSSVLFTIGMPFEKILTERIKKTVTGIKIMPMDTGIKKRSIEEDEFQHEEDKDKHHENHTHEEGENDPHVWLAPTPLKIMAENTAKIMAELKPDLAAVFSSNLDKFKKEMDELDAEIKEKLADIQGKTFLVYHPVLGYFADSYGLKQKAIEIKGKSPSPKQLAKLINAAKQDNVRTIFVQPEFDRKSAESVAKAINGRVVVLNPLLEDVITSIRNISAALLEGTPTN